MARAWDDLAPQVDMDALEARGSRLDRPTEFRRRPVLLVIDLTRSFADPGYPASCWDTGGQSALVATEEILAAARRAAVPVVFTKIHGSGPGGSFLPVDLGPALGDKPELIGTPEGLPDGNEISDRIAPRANEVVIAKPKPSGFFGTPLDAFLNHWQADSVIVVGMVTSGCVRATVVDAYMRNYHVIVPETAVADYSVFQHRAALLDMHAKYADVAAVDEVVDYLVGLSESSA